MIFNKRVINTAFILKWTQYFFIIFLMPTIVLAEPSDTAKLKASTLKLWEYPTWRHLIYAEGLKHHSAILSKDFFLSIDGNKSPRAELEATIDAFFQNSSTVQSDARCRFPARYFWLSQYLDIPQINLRDSRCIEQQRWVDFDRIKSVSFILVSGYWGNPASTFGHSLMRLNTHDQEGEQDLFDLTVNFGAKTPPHENPIRYIAKGLTGGYEGVFSDQYFYTQDLTYTRTEFRDMWDVELTLTEKEKTMLIYHLWEIMGKRYKYYFLKENCAFRFATLANVFIEDEIFDRFRLWYIPEELFFRLKEINKIKSVRYIPSSKRVLFHELKQLSQQELKVFNHIVKEGVDAIDDHMAAVPLDSKIKVLNTLLAFYQYKLIAEGSRSKDVLKKIKDKILLARLSLPARREKLSEIKTLKPAFEGSKPGTIGMGLGISKGGDSFLSLNVAGFNKAAVGDNNLEGSEFVLLDTHLGFFRDNHRAFIDQLDVIRILNLETMPIDVINERRMSWGLRVGMDRIEKNNQERLDGISSFGVGRAFRLNDDVLTYVMFDVAGHTQQPYGRLRPYVGTRAVWGKFKSTVLLGVENKDYFDHAQFIYSSKLQYTLNTSFAVQLEATNERATQFRATLQYAW